MGENISLAFQGIWNHKLRSFLTMLGIIIGIASIITIVSTIKGTNEQIKSNLIGAGTDMVNVQLVQGDNVPDFSYDTIPDGIGIIDASVCQELDKLDCVEQTAAYCSRSWADSVYYQNTSFSGQLYGVDENFFSVAGYHLAYGRGFVSEDYTGFRKVALVNAKTVDTLFNGASPIDRTIEIAGEPFTVVGVVEQSSDFQPTIQGYKDYSMYTDTSGGTIFLPLACWPVIYTLDEPASVAVRATSTDDMTAAGNNVAAYLNEHVVFNKDYSYKGQDLLEQAKKMQDLASQTSRQLIWIAGISLLVGGIGVMNIMLVSVTERTREIGLKKAIGAKSSRIRLQFLTEAAVLTSLGGLLGVLVGVVLAQLLSRIMDTPTAISIPAGLVAVVFSMAIGIVFGLIPAMKASKLNPIDALRSE